MPGLCGVRTQDRQRDRHKSGSCVERTEEGYTYINSGTIWTKRE